MMSSGSGGSSSNYPPQQQQLQMKGPSKIKIKNFVKPKLPADFFQTNIKLLTDGLMQLYQKSPDVSYESLYKTCELLCTYRYAEQAYEHVITQFKHILQEINLTLSQSSSTDNNNQADEVNSNKKPLKLLESYRLFKEFLSICKSVLLHIENHLASRQQSLYVDGIELFKELIVKQSGNQRYLQQFIVSKYSLDAVNGSDGSAQLMETVKGLMTMTLDLGIYHQYIQPLLIEDRRSFYVTDSAEQIKQADGDLYKYLLYCRGVIKTEQSRPHVPLMIDKSPILHQVKIQLILFHRQFILDNCDQLFQLSKMSIQDGSNGSNGDEELSPPGQNEEVDQDLIRLCFAYVNDVGFTEQLRVALMNKFEDLGSPIVKSGEDVEMIRKLLQLKVKTDQMIAAVDRAKLSLEDIQKYRDCVHDCMAKVVNVREDKPAELLAKYFDQMLKERQTDEQMIDQLLTLFRYIKGKDTFEAFYKKDLSKRLLLGKSNSVEYEKNVLAKLRLECGASFTVKLEGMFKDIEVSKDLNRDFKSSYLSSTGGSTLSLSDTNIDSGASPPAKRQKQPVRKIDLYVNVLTLGYWPSWPPVTLKLPEFMQTQLDEFKSFYVDRHNGRRITFQHNLDYLLLNAQFPKGNKELSVSLYQGVVLVLFNETGCEQLSFLDIKAQCGLEDQELRRTLQSLACGKVRVLTKTPKGKDVLDQDVFRVNESFTHKLHRVKINTIQYKETPKEQKQTHEQVSVDRSHQLDAAIVRVMKSRQKMSHAMLMQEVMALCKFPMTAQDFKKRIESLLDREYIEREDGNSYRYLA
ncbi:hypothetical protein MP228_007736 [Amoeboaphelidium protococcarum]|nr:hypothetical protein MP228_007736 [Amoeboaphelidium protococcarum]